MTTKQKYFWGIVALVIILLFVFRKQIGNLIGVTARAKRCCDDADYAAFAYCQQSGGGNCQGIWLGNCNGAGIGGCKGIQNVGRSQIVNQPITPGSPNVGNPPPRPIMTTT